MPPQDEGQLELFNLSNQASPRPQRYAVGRLSLSIRYDQVILAGIGALIGLTVVFASGVERGKQLARNERPVLRPTVAAVSRPVAPAPKRALKTAKPAAPKPAKAPALERLPAVASEPRPTVVVEETSQGRYAVQVVTYSRPQLAQRELERLKDSGEPAFVVTRQGRSVLFVGPFETKDNATQKVTKLKTQYQDCFVKTL